MLDKNGIALGICEKCKYMNMLSMPEGTRVIASSFGFVMSCGGMNVECVEGKTATTITGDCIVCEKAGNVFRRMSDARMVACSAYENVYDSSLD